MPLYHRKSGQRTSRRYPPDFDPGEAGYVRAPENLTFVEFQTEFLQLYLDEGIERPEDFPEGDTFCVGPHTDVLVLDGYPVVAVFLDADVAVRYLEHFDAVGYHAPVTLPWPEWAQRLREFEELKAEGVREEVETRAVQPPDCPFQVAMICAVDNEYVYYRVGDLAEFCSEKEAELTEVRALGW